MAHMEGVTASADLTAPVAGPSRPNIFSPARDYPIIQDGSLVIVYLSRDSLLPVTVAKGETSHTRYGSYKHEDMIGKGFGSKVIASNGRGFCHLLRPTPELWSLALPHRTQILYMPDIAYITSYLDIKPGSRVVEAGTGSGSFSHAVARTVGNSGKVYSFEFHEPRYEQAMKEFADHGLEKVIELRHRNVCKDGFEPATDIDAVFLDVPAPWEAVEFAKNVLARDRMTRICCFSPCIEQVTKTVTALQSAGFASITMYETLQRQHDLAAYQMPTLTDAIEKLKDIETRKKARRESQRQKALEEKAELSKKRKADEMESAADSEGAAATDVKTEETTETSTNGEAVASGFNAQQVEDSLPPSEVQSSTEEKAGTEGKTATNQPGSMNGQAKGSRTPSKKLVQEEKRYMNAKPAPQTRGHTSYLTFAFLMPESAEAVVVPVPEATSA